MTNKEFYRDEIFEIACNGHTVAVCDGKPVVCEDTQCSQCDFRGTDCTKLLKEWLEKEHEESTEWKIQPEVKKLKQDDRVLVSTNGVDWIKRYFEKYDQKKMLYTHISTEQQVGRKNKGTHRGNMQNCRKMNQNLNRKLTGQMCRSTRKFWCEIMKMTNGNQDISQVPKAEMCTRGHMDAHHTQVKH